MHQSTKKAPKLYFSTSFLVKFSVLVIWWRFFCINQKIEKCDII